MRTKSKLKTFVLVKKHSQKLYYAEINQTCLLLKDKQKFSLCSVDQQ